MRRPLTGRLPVMAQMRDMAEKVGLLGGGSWVPVFSWQVLFCKKLRERRMARNRRGETDPGPPQSTRRQPSASAAEWSESDFLSAGSSFQEMVAMSPIRFMPSAVKVTFTYSPMRSKRI